MVTPSPRVLELWDRYALPPYKRNHSQWVASLAVWLARALLAAGAAPSVDIDLLETAALLHDIDKNVPKLENEHHPDAGVRILREEGLPEVADIVKTHPLHSILDRTIAPSSIEERVLYLSDKMVKHDIITVDARFALWRAEYLPPDAVSVLERTYPMVKILEREIFGLIGVDPNDASRLVKTDTLDTIKGQGGDI